MEGVGEEEVRVRLCDRRAPLRGLEKLLVKWFCRKVRTQYWLQLVHAKHVQRFNLIGQNTWYMYTKYSKLRGTDNILGHQVESKYWRETKSEISFIATRSLEKIINLKLYYIMSYT